MCKVLHSNIYIQYCDVQFLLIRINHKLETPQNKGFHRDVDYSLQTKLNRKISKQFKKIEIKKNKITMDIFICLKDPMLCSYWL